MALKVAIVGLADTSRHLAPWADPAWEKWCLAWDVEHRYRADRTFEMHDPAEWAVMHPASYAEALEHCPKLYLREPVITGAVRYPLERVVSTVDGYFASSIAYMLALAIAEGAAEIALYGVDMDYGSEYEYQRANGEYLIGLARGRGIRVHLPEGCPLCRYTNPPGFDYAGAYGRLA